MKQRTHTTDEVTLSERRVLRLDDTARRIIRANREPHHVPAFFFSVDEWLNAKPKETKR